MDSAVELHFLLIMAPELLLGEPRTLLALIKPPFKHAGQVQGSSRLSPLKMNSNQVTPMAWLTPGGLLCSSEPEIPEVRNT